MNSSSALFQSSFSGRLQPRTTRHRATRILALLQLTSSFLVPLIMGVEITPQSSPGSAAQEVINFALIDHRGRFHELRRTDARAVVLFFTGNGCPIARQSFWKLKLLQQRYAERGVALWLINSNPQDDRASIVQEAEAFRSEPLPILKDDTQGVARMLGVNRACEVIAISTRD